MATVMTLNTDTTLDHSQKVVKATSNNDTILDHSRKAREDDKHHD